MSLKSLLIKSIFLGLQNNKEEITSLIQEKLNKQIKINLTLLEKLNYWKKKAACDFHSVKLNYGD